MSLKPVFQFLEVRPWRAVGLLLISFWAEWNLLVKVLFPLAFSINRFEFELIFTLILFSIISYHLMILLRFIGVVIGSRNTHLEEIYESVKRTLRA